MKLVQTAHKKSIKMSFTDKNTTTWDPRLWLIALALLILVFIFIRAYP